MCIWVYVYSKGERLDIDSANVGNTVSGSFGGISYGTTTGATEWWRQMDREGEGGRCDSV
jgi:hypothetical protein